VLGVTRTYTTRHGAGPFPTEDRALGAVLPEPHNGVGEYQGSFRVGHLDTMLLRYAVEVSGGVDGLALTHLDALERATSAGTPIQGVDRYDWCTSIPVGKWKDLEHQAVLTEALRTMSTVPREVPDEVEQFVDYLGSEIAVPVVLTSDGPDRADRRLRAGVPA
jgi:adenylosuccinate synthase